MEVKDWVGRKARIASEGASTDDAQGTVLAVDDTPYRPSAWIRIYEDRDYPAYRSVDLCWLTDIETGEEGPAWGTGGPEADMAQMKAKREARGN